MHPFTPNKIIDVMIYSPGNETFLSQLSGASCYVVDGEVDHHGHIEDHRFVPNDPIPFMTVEQKLDV